MLQGAEEGAPGRPTLKRRQPSFNESYYPVFTKRIQITVGKHERSLAYAAITPGNFPGIKTHGCKYATGKAIEIIAD